MHVYLYHSPPLICPSVIATYHSSVCLLCMRQRRRREERRDARGSAPAVSGTPRTLSGVVLFFLQRAISWLFQTLYVIKNYGEWLKSQPRGVLTIQMKKASLKNPHGGHVMVYKSRFSKTFRSWKERAEWCRHPPAALHSSLLAAAWPWGRGGTLTFCILVYKRQCL